MLGSRISHYEVTRKLGEGGMGVVYRAEDTRLGRSVALKFLPPEATTTNKDRLRFEQEARAAARLNHPSICTIHSFDEHDGRPFLVMEYVEGITLRERLRGGPLPIDEAITCAIKIAEALSEAHEAGIIHRDIKPGNIMLGAKGNIKVMDFGLAKLRGAQHITRTGNMVGTIAYMAPEQLQGREVDHRADIFSLGIVLYEMLTGQHPFLGEYKQAVAYRLVNEDPLPPSTYRPEIPPELDALVLRCLAKDRKDRYNTAEDVLKEFRDGPLPSPPAERSTSSQLRRLFSAQPYFGYVPPTRMAAVGLLVVIVAGAMLFSWFWGGYPEERIPLEKHLVVLPFTNLSEDTIPPALGSGIMEMLTSKITQMESHEGNLWVVPSSEVRGEQVSSVTEAARLFGANLAITGSLQRTGDRFRLTMNLVDGPTMRQLRSSVLELEWTDFAQLQDEVVQALTGLLELETAPQRLQTMVAGGSDDPRAYQLYVEGRGFLSRYEDLESVESAIERFEAAIALDSSYARAHAGLGEAYWHKYDHTNDDQWAAAARTRGRRAIELNDRIPEAFITMAFIYNGMGRHDDALGMLERLQEDERMSSAALREEARAYEGQGRLDRAEEAYLRAIEQKSNYWGGYHLLGRFYNRHGRFAEAAEAFRSITELTPDNTRGYNNLGATYFALQRYEDARQAFQQSLQIQPNYVALSNLGTLYYYEGRYPEAIRQYEQAIELRDTDFRVWGNLGSAYYWTDEDAEKITAALERAIALAEQAREVSPNNPRLLVQLAGFYGLLGERDRAQTMLSHATSMDTLDPESMVVAAHVYEQLGNRDTALHWIEEALQRGYHIQALESLPGMDALLNDPRMDELQHNVGEQAPSAVEG